MQNQSLPSGHACTRDADGSEAISLSFAEQAGSIGTESFFAHVSNHINNALHILETANILEQKADRLRVYHRRDVLAAKLRLRSALELIGRQLARKDAAGEP